jgi:hypothetical protein
MNASHHKDIVLELSYDKQYTLRNKDEKEGHQLSIRLIPHQDGNVSMAVFNGGNTEAPVFTKKLWAVPIEQVTQASVNKLADAFPTANRAREMQDQGISRPESPKKFPTQSRGGGADRNGIKRL